MNTNLFNTSIVSFRQQSD